MNEQRPTIIVAFDNPKIPVIAWTYRMRHERFMIRATYRMLRKHADRNEAREFLIGLLSAIPETAEYRPVHLEVVR